jgi:hypothetical protein
MVWTIGRRYDEEPTMHRLHLHADPAEAADPGEAADPAEAADTDAAGWAPNAAVATGSADAAEAAAATDAAAAAEPSAGWPSPDALERTVGRFDAYGPSAADLAVAAGRELSTEQLVNHARALGPDPRLSALTDAELERRFVSHTVALNAATAQWFVLLAEVVVRGLWADQGARTPAQWLSWRIGLAPSTAREQLRVAIRLRELPEVMERFATGRLSYSKVRAITRIAVPELQQLLLAWAEHATGADLERIARGVSRARRSASTDPDLRPPLGVDLRYEDDAAVIALRLPLEDGLEVYQALERLTDAEEALLAAETDPSGGEAPGSGYPMDGLSDEVHPAGDPELRAEPAPGAAVPRAGRSQLMAEVAAAVILGAKDRTPPDTSGLDRHTLVVEVAGDDLAREDGQVPVRVPGERVPAMSARVLRRLACGAGIVPVTMRDGRPLDVGRRQREPNAQQRRALRARDRSCRFPGCGAIRHLHAHHVVHWSDGGPTDLDNLILLCSFHHRLVHQPGWRLEHIGDGRYRFHGPGDRPLAPAPALDGSPPDPADVEPVGATVLTPTSWSTDDPLDLDLVISVVDQELRLAAPHLLTAAA